MNNSYFKIFKNSKHFFVLILFAIILTGCSTQSLNISSTNFDLDNSALSIAGTVSILSENALNSSQIVSSSIESTNIISSGVESVSEILSTVTMAPSPKPQPTSVTSEVKSDKLIFSDIVLENLIRQCVKKQTGIVTSKDFAELGYSVLYIRPFRSDNQTIIELFDSNSIKEELTKSTAGLISNFDVLEQLTNIKSLSIIYLGEIEGASDIEINLDQINNIRTLENLSIFMTKDPGENVIHGFHFKNFNSISTLSSLKTLNISSAKNIDLNVISNHKKLYWLNLYNCGLTDISSLSKLTYLEKVIVPKNNITNGDALLTLKLLKEVNLSENPIGSNTEFLNNLKKKFPGIKIW